MTVSTPLLQPRINCLIVFFISIGAPVLFFERMANPLGGGGVSGLPIMSIPSGTPLVKKAVALFWDLEVRFLSLSFSSFNKNHFLTPLPSHHKPFPNRTLKSHQPFPPSSPSQNSVPSRCNTESSWWRKLMRTRWD